ncbi:NnrS family protein [Euryhalocaulis caribicus]|uniref:NnrS family protein n=1 Tax=Euryhalocaulis caribicus TaxID=1161401 RepID=UPI0019D6E743|nr:NnrS family protein [Euryhalocaulis caribicus]
MLQFDKFLKRRRRAFDPLAQRREYAGPALFSYGFRPFFLFGAAWSAIIVPIWALFFATGRGDVGGLSALYWHTHEMLFGFLSAIVAGFMLTAIPNWTSRLPVLGIRLMLLSGLWGAGRGAMLVYESMGIAAALVDAAFLIALALFAWKEVLIGRNWKNAPICFLASVLALANIAFHGALLAGDDPHFAQNAAIAVLTIMISIIGGRIVPSFTRNWMAQSGLSPLPVVSTRFDWIALIVLVAGLIAWLVRPDDIVTAGLLASAAILHFWRLAGWKGWRTLAEPLVTILHLGYFWLPTALVLMAAAILASKHVQPSAALHALTAGAMGTMTLAVMTRASLGHTGRARTADRWIVTIYILVLTAAIVRTFGPITVPENYDQVISYSAALWALAFAGFVARFGYVLSTPRQA